MYPEEFRYTKDHEWIKLENEIGIVGITQHAQEELGDVVFVELPEVDTEVKAGEPMGTIESVKAVADLFAPMSGKIIEVNEALVEEPELVNTSPHERGWMVKLQITAPEEQNELMDSKAYEEYCQQESEH